MIKKKASFLVTVIVIISLSVFILILRNQFLKPDLKTNVDTSKKPTNNLFTINPTQISKAKSSDTTFPHDLLSGFNISIPNSWVISKVKQFGEKDNVGFTSIYFNQLPDQGSMAFRIFKNGIFFDLIFDLIYDDAPTCSNDLPYMDIGKGWYRMGNNNNYFYTKNVLFNGSPIGETQKYKVCIFSGTKFLSPPAKEISPGDGVIILENVKVYGNPSMDIIYEVDDILRSITGIK